MKYQYDCKDPLAVRRSAAQRSIVSRRRMAALSGVTSRRGAFARPISLYGVSVSSSENTDVSTSAIDSSVARSQDVLTSLLSGSRQLSAP